MSQAAPEVPAEMFRDVKFYVVGDVDPQVLQLLKAGKAKEVSYNALASHIISEDGDNPEVGEAREVFDLPVVKPSWVTLSVQCGTLLPASGFSPESGQVFSGVAACLSQVSAEDRSALWALLTFYGGACQLALTKRCTHLVVPEPKGEKYECALRRASVKVVTPDWVLDCVSEKSRKDEAAYHPRLIIYEEEEEEEDDDEEEEEEEEEAENDGSTDEKSSAVSSREGSPATGRHFSPPGPPKKGQEKEELMFDDSSDSSPEKQERNLNWTPAEIPQVATAKRRLVPGKEPGLINLCANVPPVPGGALPPDGRPGLLASGQPLQGAERPDFVSSWSSTARTLRNITNSTDVQTGGRPPNVAQILQSLSAPTKSVEQQLGHSQAGHGSANALLFGPAKGAPEPHLPPPPPPVLHLPPQQLLQPPFAPPQAHSFSAQLPQAHTFPSQQLHRPLQQHQLQHQLQQLQQLQQQQQHLRLHPPQTHLQTHPQTHPPLPAVPGPQPLSQPSPALPPQPLVPHQAQPHQLFGHDPAVEIPEGGFLLGCVFAIADYHEQMSDKQLLATWKKIIQAHGGMVDPAFSSRCTHLLCESQVSSTYAQAIRERKRCVTAHWLNSVLKRRRMVPPHRTLHFPVAFPPGGKPCAQHIISVTGT